MLFTSQDGASVNIDYGSSSSNIQVPSGQTVTFALGSDLRVDSGLESNKGIIITSDNPISVHLASEGFVGYRVPDAVLVRPLPDPGDHGDVFMAGFGEGYIADTWNPKSFYMVVASDGDTDVQVYVRQGGSYVLDESFILQVGGL